MDGKLLKGTVGVLVLEELPKIGNLLNVMCIICIICILKTGNASKD
jgi:hypothetical protein